MWRREVGVEGGNEVGDVAVTSRGGCRRGVPWQQRWWLVTVGERQELGREKMALGGGVDSFVNKS